MIITKYLMHKGKKVHISEISSTSGHKVFVRCPVCDETRNVHYRSVCAAGHCICLKCIRKTKQRKYLNIGDKYNKLTITNHSKRSGFSICKCECGNIVEVYNYNLEMEKTQSCGCLKRENFRDAIILKGEKHGMWKGGVSSERERFMSTKEYRDWRISVFERDNFTCQKCGQVGYELNAHHIKNYAGNKELRTNIDNGVTLCEECHRIYHKEYGRQDNTNAQFKEFLMYNPKVG